MDDSYGYIRSANNILEKGAGKADADIKKVCGRSQIFQGLVLLEACCAFTAAYRLITKVLTTGDPELFAPRSTRQPTADLILKDLE
jgi:hypothetical protein